MPSPKARTFRAALTSGIAVVLAVGLAACGSSGSSTNSSGSGSGATGSREITIGTIGPITNTWNPLEPGAPVTEFVEPVYDTLIHYQDGKLVPWLATSWEFKDPTTLELKLRSDVTFTDGTKFDAEAVKANFQYAIDKKANYLDQQFLAGITEMTVVDPTTIDLKLSEPNAALPFDFTQYSGLMVSPKALQAPDTLKAAPVGSGPYLLDTALTRPGTTIVFKRNPDYWAKDQNLFPFDKLTYSIISDPTAAKNAASTGQVQALTIQPDTTIEGFQTVTSVSGSQSGMTGAWIDATGTALPALGDEKVRQAMGYAIDRSKVGQAVYKDTAIPVPLVPIVKGDAAYSDELAAKYPYDQAKAKQLLTEAGYPNGFEFTLISLPAADQFAQAIAGQLQQVGIKVNIESHTSDLVQAVQSGTRPAGMALIRLTGDNGQDLAQLFNTNAFSNVHHADDPDLQALLKQAAAESDETARDKILQEAALRGADDAWYFATIVLQTITAFDSKVVTVVPPDRGAIHLYDYHLPA